MVRCLPTGCSSKNYSIQNKQQLTCLYTLNFIISKQQILISVDPGHRMNQLLQFLNIIRYSEPSRQKIYYRLVFPCNMNNFYVYVTCTQPHKNISSIFGQNLITRKTLAYLMHLATYSKEPKCDCNSFFEQDDLVDHWRQNCLITVNFSWGMEIEQSSVLTRIPKHITLVLGGTNFFSLMVRPSS